MQDRVQDFACSFELKAEASDSATFTGVASTSGVDLQNEIIEAGAFEPIETKKAPSGEMVPDVLMLRDHDRTQVIGGWRSFQQMDDKLVVEGELALEVPKARETYALIKKGYISGLSVGYSLRDPKGMMVNKDGKRIIKRGAGLLRECSIVSFPANRGAQIVAVKSELNDWLSARGFDPQDLEGLLRLYQDATEVKADERWVVGGARDLPIAETERGWDAAAARRRIFARANFGGDGTPNVAFARRAFLIYDAANPELIGSYSLPFADIVDGVLKVIPSALRAAASRLPQVTGVAQAVKDRARAILDRYFARLEEKQEYKADDRLANLISMIDAILSDDGELDSALATKLRGLRDALSSANEDDDEEEAAITASVKQDTHADPGYLDDEEPRLPLGTEAQIRAAWKNIHSEDVRSQYDADQIRRIEHRIIAAWKRVIDEAGPPAWRGNGNNERQSRRRLRIGSIEDAGPVITPKMALTEMNSLLAALKGRNNA